MNQPLSALPELEPVSDFELTKLAAEYHKLH